MATKENETMNAQEVCEMLKISRATLTRLVKDGTVKPLPKSPVLKRAAKLEFRREDVERLAQSS